MEDETWTSCVYSKKKQRNCGKRSPIITAVTSDRSIGSNGRQSSDNMIIRIISGIPIMAVNNLGFNDFI